jgi:hypothetical protein
MCWEVGFEVRKAASMKVAVFWLVALFRLLPVF